MLLFCVAVPLIILYADGYRYRSDVGLFQTGGIYGAIAPSGASISMNNLYVGTSGLLKHDFYIGNLSPDVYTVNVTEKDYHPWNRTLVVEQNLVTSAAALLVPETFTMIRLTTSTTTPSVKDTSLFRIITLAERTAYLQTFSAHASTTQSGAVEEAGGEGLFISNGDVFVRWLNTDTAEPANVCGRPSFCVSEIAIQRGPQTTTRAAFYGGGVVYRTNEGGIFFAEADVRPTPLRIALYPKAGADFIISQGSLIIKNGQALYELEGL